MLKQMKVVLGATAVGGVIGVASIGGVQQGTGMQATPSAGLLPGGSFLVENLDGAECLDGQVTGDSDLQAGQWVATVDGTGDWQITLQVPAATAPGAYGVRAHCAFSQPATFGAPAQVPDFDYTPITVTVVAQPATTTTTTTTTTTIPPATAPTAIVAAPTVTG
jgi:hypothetical protein